MSRREKQSNPNFNELLVRGEHTLREAGLQPEDAVPLLEYSLTQSADFILSHPELSVTPDQVRIFDDALQQRIAGRPVAFIRGSQFFYGLRFFVTDATLIPRPESELLVEEAINFLKIHPHSQVLDMGTGSGNIIIAITHSFPQTAHTFHATDISRNALAVAKKNAREHRIRVRFYHSNLFQNIPRLKFDLIIANLPYLTAEQLAEPSIKYEPVGALWGGTQGIELYQHFFSELGPYLSAHAMVCIEIDPDQKNELTELARSYFPTATIDCIPDLSGRSRIIRIQTLTPDTPTSPDQARPLSK